MRTIVTAFIFLLAMLSHAQEPAKSFEMTPIPGELTWVNQPLNWDYSNNVLTITGGKGSRLFVDPQRNSEANTAPMALFRPVDNFQFSCKMKVDFKSIFDAGVLMVYGNGYQWAKLCFEYTPQLQPMLVSVVNNEVSDDSNHILIDGHEVYARISGMGSGVYVFHYSLDGKYWHMLRYFYLDPKHELKVGFLSQSPRGESCKTEFSEVNYSAQRLKDIRSGE